jgi:hypothetical protein
MSTQLQGCTQFLIVIDFPIENDEDTVVFIKDGLMASCQIDNGKSAHAQGDSISHPRALIVGSAMPNHLAHLIDQLLRPIVVVVFIDKSSYSAHESVSILSLLQ